MPHEKEVPSLDLKAMLFPSDRITVSQMRRDQPNLFSEKGLFGPRGYNHVLNLNFRATMNSERILARKAFAAAAGQADPCPDNDRLELIMLLSDDYKRFGISSGIHQTRLLVREFETVATQQAKGARGPSR
jgi:hypothetical protein